jgi:hypothetical protein
MLLYLFERLYCLFCRHEWIRDRRDDGTLGLRCMKCLRRTEHSLTQLINWKPAYPPIQLSHESDFPLPITREFESHAGDRLPPEAA